MKTLYLDIFSGISGDMFLGAVLDLGLDFHQLEREIARLGVTGYHLHAARKTKASIQGVKFDVHIEHHHSPDETPHVHDEHDSDGHHHHHHHDHNQHGEDGHDHEHQHEHDHEHEHEHEHEHHHDPHPPEPPTRDTQHAAHRDFAEIQDLISRSSLSPWVKEKSVAVFRRIAVAEGKIHGHPPERVHFHEVGAIDSIVDIVGACVALEMLGQPRVLASPVVEGTGWVHCAHGRFPIPTTATLEILGARGIPVTQCDEPHELVTPTGAALLAEFVESFAPMTQLIASKIGYGLGTRDNHTRPNVLRAVLGAATSPAGAHPMDWETDTVTVIETNLDDATPELLGDFIEQTLLAGALDIFYAPAQMKKNRPGVLLTVLCAPSDADRFSEMLLRHTTAFGLRRHTIERRKLRREFVQVKTAHGEVTVKIGKLNGAIVQAAPEYESCRQLAAKMHLPLKQIYDSAVSCLKGNSDG